MADNGSISIGPVRVYFRDNSLFAPNAYQGKGEAKFHAQFGILAGSEEFKTLVAHMNSVIKTNWPNLSLKDVKHPLKKGENERQRRILKAQAAGKEVDDNYAAYLNGRYLFKADTKGDFALARGEMVGRAVVEVTQPSKFHSGMDAQINISCVKTHDTEGLPRIKFYLNGVVKVGKGEPIGRGDPMSVLQGIAGTVTTFDPTGDEPLLDDDIAF